MFTNQLRRNGRRRFLGSLGAAAATAVSLGSQNTVDAQQAPTPGEQGRPDEKRADR